MRSMLLRLSDCESRKVVCRQIQHLAWRLVQVGPIAAAVVAIVPVAVVAAATEEGP